MSGRSDKAILGTDERCEEDISGSEGSSEEAISGSEGRSEKDISGSEGCSNEDKFGSQGCSDEDDFDVYQWSDINDSDTDEETSVETDNENMKVDGLPIPKPVSPIASNEPIKSIEIPASRAGFLVQRGAEVFSCRWNPQINIFAYGVEAFVHTYRLIGNNGHGKADVFGNHCGRALRNQEKRYISSLDWDCDGKQLAYSTYKGHLEVRDSEGQYVRSCKYGEPIYECKWNKRKDLIVSAVGNSAMVWHVKSKTEPTVQAFNFHNGRVLGVDWNSNTTFASCSAATCDNPRIYMCEVGVSEPLYTFRGHSRDINMIQWHPQGQFLASCSDDKTVKIWDPKFSFCVRNLTGHSHNVGTLKWSNTGTQNVDMMLASGSEDTTVKLWDVESGLCEHNLTDHTDRVSSVDFSPNGKLLVSGGHDKMIYIWSTNDGQLVHKYKGTGPISEVCWNYNGQLLGACGLDGSVFGLDLRKM